MFKVYYGRETESGESTVYEFSVSHEHNEGSAGGYADEEHTFTVNDETGAISHNYVFSNDMGDGPDCFSYSCGDDKPDPLETKEDALRFVRSWKDEVRRGDLAELEVLEAALVATSAYTEDATYDAWDEDEDDEGEDGEGEDGEGEDEDEDE
jgi:hypothetical protein